MISHQNTDRLNLTDDKKLQLQRKVLPIPCKIFIHPATWTTFAKLATTVSHHFPLTLASKFGKRCLSANFNDSTPVPLLHNDHRYSSTLGKKRIYPRINTLVIEGWRLARRRCTIWHNKKWKFIIFSKENRKIFYSFSSACFHVFFNSFNCLMHLNFCDWSKGWFDTSTMTSSIECNYK